MPDAMPKFGPPHPLHVLKPEQLFVDMLVGSVILVVAVIFFWYCFAPQLRRAMSRDRDIAGDGTNYPDE